MKVLFINSVCGIRSTGRIVTDLAEAYMAQGHECKVAYGRETVPDMYKSISYRIGTQWDVRKNALKARLLDNEAFNAKRETKRFIQWVNDYDPDVLWLHNLHGYYMNIELLFDWIKSRPQMQVKWTLHDCWAFTGHCAHFTMVQCPKWKEHCSNCSQRRRYPASLVADNSSRNYDRKRQAFTGVQDMILITPSHWLAERTKQSFLKEYAVEVHHNTIDTGVFRPTPGNFREKYGLQNKTIILGVASAWSQSKGLEDFKKLFAMLNDPYKVVLVGLSGKQMKQIPKEILGIQRTNSAKELAEIYTASDVFVNLTYEDTYPTVNLEAQACGTPCITYRTGGSVESVPEDHVVEQGDLPGVIAKIEMLKDSKVK